MYYKLLIILHLIGAAVWTGGHLVLSLSVLPKAIKTKAPDVIKIFEERFEKAGIPALLLQVVTGIALAKYYVPDILQWFSFTPGITRVVGIKLSLLVITLVLAVHARLFIIPRLSSNNLGMLAAHIIIVTVIAVLMVASGASVRWGGI